MTAPHDHTTDEVKASIRKISRNKGRADNEGPVSIGGGSTGVMTTMTKDVTPPTEGADVVNKRPV